MTAVGMPLTRESLARSFGELGIERGEIVLVHSAMSRLGWIAGGVVALLRGLLDAVGERGTIVVPTHTGANTDPARWKNPPAPQAWWATIRESLPAFDPARTPGLRMGAVAEALRTWPGARRGDHPTVSFAALGPAAAEVVHPHPLESVLGEGSPLARLYRMDARVLLLGVGHDRNTSLHLAESRARIPRTRFREGTAVLVEGSRRWVEFDTDELDSDDFPALGTAFEATHALAPGWVGRAEARLLGIRPLVDFGIPWLEEHRAEG